MLKTTGLLNKPALSKNDGSRSTSSRNKVSKSAFGKNDGNGEVDELCVSRNNVEYIKKSGKLISKKTSKFRKLSKLGKSKSEKTSKFQKLSKSGKLKGKKTSKS